MVSETSGETGTAAGGGTSAAAGTGTNRRRWRGADPADRTARRREQLVAATLELMATEGAAAVTMRGVCRAAGLSERYFYESFTDRGALLITVLESVVLPARDRLAAAVASAPPDPADAIRHGVAVFTRYLTEDPRRGRILFVESQAAPELARRGGELVGEFTTIIAGTLGARAGAADPADIEINARAVFGALAFVYQSWLARHPHVDPDRLTEHLSQVIERIGSVSTARGR
ncbi:MAG TPA: TetR/AcrR family transcriptional regulator [Pseudonocardia sp.]|jgi:AcrR family transcriptional regulator|nr:TetR/AcrR family transcriptional regulator [Pseudonocardia sp.]